MDIKPEHLAVLKRAERHFETAKHGWVKEVQELDMLEHIYIQYLDSRFVLTKWCSDCVFNMIVRLGNWHESLPKQIRNENTRARKSK